jgi:hypothetical protein
MLEDTRKRGATIIIYLIFGVLIAVFVVNFGPQSMGGGRGCQGAGSETKLTIAGEDYGWNTWRWALNNQGEGPYQQRAIGALDGLVRRELLAQEAERRGLEVPESVIDDNIKNARLYILGQPIAEADARRIYFDDGEFFNYKMLEGRLVRPLGLTIASFKAEQRREVLAASMVQILASGGHASRDEAYAEWISRELKVTIDAVRFPVSEYKDKLILADADVDRFLASHEAAVTAAYEADKASKYTGSAPRKKLRRVFVERAELDPAADPAGDDAAGTEPAPPPPDPGKAKLEAARAEIVAKKKSFADVARALDSDDAIRGKGGDVGWKLVDAPNLGDPLLDAAVKDLAVGGEPSAVLDTPDGFWLLAADDEREGDLSFDQVKREIAATMAVDTWAREAARRDAITALVAARQAGKALADLYDKDESAPAVTPEQQIEGLRRMLLDPELDPGLRQQIEELLRQAESGELGQLGTWESADVPAAWQQDDPGGGPPAPSPPPPAAPAEDLMTPSSDQLPKLGTLDKRLVERIGPANRRQDRVLGLGESPELVKALFEQLDDGALADRIYEVRVGGAYGGGETEFVVVQLIERTRPDLTAFDNQADQLVAQLEARRGAEIVRDWMLARCTELVERERIRINNDLLVTGDEGERRSFQYGGVCQRL